MKIKDSFFFDIRSAEVYDPRTDQWTQIADMTTARDGACNVSDGESIYVIGGYDGHEYTLTTEVYKPETGAWDVTCKFLYDVIFV